VFPERVAVRVTEPVPGQTCATVAELTFEEPDLSILATGGITDNVWALVVSNH
jgi:hypothetical protein